MSVLVWGVVGGGAVVVVVGFEEDDRGSGLKGVKRHLWISIG